jgi:threonine dehydratase
MLGFGGGAVFELLTPVVLTITSGVVSYVVNSVLNGPRRKASRSCSSEFGSYSSGFRLTARRQPATNRLPAPAPPPSRRRGSNGRDDGVAFSAMTAGLTRDAIASAYALIRPHVRVTPIVWVSGADFGLAPFPLVFKLEHLQHAGSFKTRGAFTHLLRREIPPAGVVAASGGNHGAAVAHAAMRRRVPARIFVPTVSSPAKISRIRGYGAELVVGGDRYADALAASEEWAAESGAMTIHAFDQLETLLGQATIGLELSEQAPDLDTLLVAVGGGGLIGGIAAWYAGRIRVIGVEPVDAPTLTEALRVGRPADAPTGSIAADSLAPRRVGEHMFPIARAYVGGVVVVSDRAILDAQAALWSTLRLVVEPGGATPLAALLCGAYVPAADERVGVLLSGANTTAVEFER